MTETKERGAGTKEQVRFFANQVEARIIDGAEVLLGEDERLWLAGLMEDRGVDLKSLVVDEINIGEKTVRAESCDTGKGVKTLTAQTAFVEKAFGGRVKMIDVFQEMMEKTVKESKKTEVEGFVARYLAEHDHDGMVVYDESGDLLKCRLEAFISATHRLLLVVAQEGEEKSVFRQSDRYTLKFLRERVMRGWEKKKEAEKPAVTLSPTIARSDEKIIRSLPIGGVEVILETLLS